MVRTIAIAITDHFKTEPLKIEFQNVRYSNVFGIQASTVFRSPLLLLFPPFSMKHLYLSSEGMHSGQRGYIVCGTAHCFGEDITPRGFVRIYDVIEVIPEPGQPLTKNKIKSVYEKEQKGAITAIASVSGFLIAAVGQKVKWSIIFNLLTTLLLTSFGPLKLILHYFK